MMERKIREYHLKARHPKDCSIMDVVAEPVSIRVFISNRFGTRNRRQLLLTLYRAVEPHLEFMMRSTIHHAHQEPPEIFRKDEFVELSLKQGIHVVDEKSQLGYFIRGIRTKIALTQKAFAKELGIDSSYLSRIERGKCAASSQLIRRIYEYDEKKSTDGVFG